MDKRQDTIHCCSISTAWLTLSLFLILFLTACQSDRLQPPFEPTPFTSRAITNTPATSPKVDISPQTQTPTPATEGDCLLEGGNVHSGSIFSEQLGEDLHYQVYLPPCYDNDAETRYPVAYLLHGLTYDENQWLRLGVAEWMDRLIADGTIAPFIIIMPREARFLPPQTSAFGETLVNELIPWIDEQYRTLPEKPNRAIAGLSRGAAWAVHLGLEHHHLFNSIGAHSLPLFEIDGGRLIAWLAQNSADELPEFLIDIGRGDPERLSAQAFADQLNAHHIPHTWYLFNGGHTETYWSAHQELYLRWYARDWLVK